ncbi:MAG TPA: alkaline phosphatase family protein, partial [Pyrinomonadaceae bacterium]|nr:alkaline phosphatase family protein [Pyrinomonadaceae bacterium]
FQHTKGPFTREAFELLEKSDAYLARMLAAYERAGLLAETAVFVVSDHGFLPSERQIHPNVLLARAGLLTLREVRDARGETRAAVASWRVIAQPTSGSCAVYLRDPRDREALRLAREAFAPYATAEKQSPATLSDDEGRRMEGRPRPALLHVVEAAELRRLGANPRAALYLKGRNGSSFGNNLTGDPVTPHKDRGNHGFLPTLPDYHSSFVASGAGVTRRGTLGRVDMTSIGPTIARALGLRLRHAESRPLSLR